MDDITPLIFLLNNIKQTKHRRLNIFPDTVSNGKLHTVKILNQNRLTLIIYTKIDIPSLPVIQKRDNFLFQFVIEGGF